MANFSQLPGELGLTFIPGDECSIAVNLQRSVAGYTFTSFIYQTDTSTTGGGTGLLNSIGKTVVAPTISISSTTAGSMIVGLSEAQTGVLSPGTNYRWFLRWVAPGDITRTIVSGTVTPVAP